MLIGIPSIIRLKFHDFNFRRPHHHPFDFVVVLDETREQLCEEQEDVGRGTATLVSCLGLNEECRCCCRVDDARLNILEENFDIIYEIELHFPESNVLEKSSATIILST